MSIQVDYTLKIIIAGDTQVGKTTFLQTIQDIRRSQLHSNSSSNTTIGVDLSLLHYNINNKHIKIQMWDTAGQERYQAITRTYFRNICGIILMFDVSKPDTFENLKKWMSMISYETSCTHRHPILLLGNKSELTNVIDKQSLDDFIRCYKVRYNEISCLQHSHLEEMFISFISEILDDVDIDKCCGIRTQCDNNNNSRMRLDNFQENTNNYCCRIA